MILSREKLVKMATICEKAERYEDMLKYVKKLVSIKHHLTVTERTLLATAYKIYIGKSRTSLHILKNLEKTQKCPKKKHHLKTLKKKIQSNLSKNCKQILQTLEHNLIPFTKKIPTKIFLLKMKADFYKYISEFAKNEEKEEIAKKSFENYTKAIFLSKKLVSSDPIRLAVILNFSVFFYEIKNDPKQACQLAKTAFDDAMEEVRGDGEFADSLLIMQIMKDNLTLWTSELEEGEDDNSDDEEF